MVESQWKLYKSTFPPLNFSVKWNIFGGYTEMIILYDLEVAFFFIIDYTWKWLENSSAETIVMWVLEICKLY